jgi:hypothetical protein
MAEPVEEGIPLLRMYGGISLLGIDPEFGAFSAFWLSFCVFCGWILVWVLGEGALGLHRKETGEIFRQG